MAKKPSQSDRRAVIDSMRKKQKGADRRRGFAIVGVCATIALLIVAFPVYGIIKERLDLREFKDKNIEAIGAPASACQKVITKPAAGSSQHVPETQQVIYEDAPPAFGEHWNVGGLAPDPIERKIYDAGDRPELEALVHNLEHGYAILWYDETAAADDEQMTEIRALADKFKGESNLRLKFKAVPWTSEDAEESGQDFPDGQHIALTHWSKGGSDADVEDTSLQKGIWQYCSDVSGAALNQFMLDYPYTDSPEPLAG